MSPKRPSPNVITTQKSFTQRFFTHRSMTKRSFTQRTLTQKMLTQKDVDPKKTFTQKDVDPKKMLAQKGVGPKRCWPKKDVGPKRCWPKKTLTQKRRSPKKTLTQKRRSPKKTFTQNFWLSVSPFSCLVKVLWVTFMFGEGPLGEWLLGGNGGAAGRWYFRCFPSSSSYSARHTLLTYIVNIPSWMPFIICPFRLAKFAQIMAL